MDEFEGEFLRWTDLTDLEVYHVAHLEHEAREKMNSAIGNLATKDWNDFEEISDRVELAITQYHEQLRFSDEWLENEAELRDYDGVILFSEPEDVPEVVEQVEEVTVDHKNFASWLDDNFGPFREQLSVKELAALANVAARALSRLLSGENKNPYTTTLFKLVTCLADLWQLKDEERTRYIDANVAELRRILPRQTRAPRSKR